MTETGSLLLTGASGLLGSNFALAAAARGLDVTAVYHRNPVRFPGIRGLRLDLTDERGVTEAVASTRPDWIVHCAAETRVDWCEDHPEDCSRVNEGATGTLARAASEIGASLLYVSTDSVYPGDRGNYTEDDRTGPVNHYGRTKLRGEGAVRATPGDHLIIRTNIFGWNLQEKQSLAEWFLAHLEGGRTVPGFRDVIFTPVLVNELAEICLALMAAGATGTYNCGSPEPCSKYEFGVSVARTFGLDPGLVRPIRQEELGLRAPRPLDTSLNSRKMHHLLKRPVPGLPDQLIRFRLLRESGYAARLRSFSGGL
ncbi:MAG: SDR family oxidoreductase [Methanomicrobiales archaeon]|nr:SDR family oxidoreductase [Methanomicrobiales archaeon]